MFGRNQQVVNLGHTEPHTDGHHNYFTDQPWDRYSVNRLYEDYLGYFKYQSTYKLHEQFKSNSNYTRKKGFLLNIIFKGPCSTSPRREKNNLQQKSI